MTTALKVVEPEIVNVSAADGAPDPIIKSAARKQLLPNTASCDSALGCRMSCCPDLRRLAVISPHPIKKPPIIRRSSAGA
jgi:hypothetical protein